MIPIGTVWSECFGPIGTVWSPCELAECVGGIIATFTADDGTAIDGVSYIPDQGALNGTNATVQNNEASLVYSGGNAWMSCDPSAANVSIKLKLIELIAAGDPAIPVIYILGRSGAEGSVSTGSGITFIGDYQTPYWRDGGSDTALTPLSEPADTVEITLVDLTLSWVFKNAAGTVIGSGSQTVAAGPGTLVNVVTRTATVDNLEVCPL